MTATIEQKLNEINHYSHIPEMKPFIGEKYYMSERRILIIGESHFFDHLPKTENPECNPGAQVWYSYEKNIPLEKLERLNTRIIVKDAKHRIFTNLKSILSEILQIDKNEVLENIAFMNAFQRPANHEGVGMEKLAQEIDFEIGAQTINSVIKIINPSHVIFVSKLCWEKIGKRIKNSKTENYKLDFTSHPNSVDWNTSNHPNNKEKLREILKN